MSMPLSFQNAQEIKNLKKDKLDEDIITILEPIHQAVTNYNGYGQSYFYKRGTKVHVHIGAKVDTTEFVNAFILPEGYRPRDVATAVGLGASTKTIATLQVYSSGGIHIYSENGYCCIDIEFDVFN